MIGAPVRSAADDEAAAAEPLQLVALGERLADALEALGPDADQLAAGQQPLGVGVAGQRRAGLAGQLADERHLEDQVGAEHPQVPVRRVLVVQRDLGHQRVQRDRAGVVGDDERAARRPACSPCRAPRPGTSAGRAGAAAASSTWSVSSASKPNSSTS